LDAIMAGLPDRLGAVEDFLRFAKQMRTLEAMCRGLLKVTDSGTLAVGIEILHSQLEDCADAMLTTLHEWRDQALEHLKPADQ
jgi:hypothetical protein